MRITPLILALLITACRNQETPPAPTSEETQQLDDAEAMLNDLATNAEGPEHSPGPSNSSN